jgi:hypothetical protein
VKFLEVRRAFECASGCQGLKRVHRAEVLLGAGNRARKRHALLFAA